MASSSTGRPWQALRTPVMIFERLNGSVTPLRLTTARTASSTVVNRRLHSGHERRRRMSWPSSASRESTTRESGCRQYGQRTILASIPVPGPPHEDTTRRATTALPGGVAVHVPDHEPWCRPQPMEDLHPCKYYILWSGCASRTGDERGVSPTSATGRQDQPLAGVHREVPDPVQPPDVVNRFERIA